MASPQVENGHLKIAYDLVTALLCQDLTGLQKDIVIAVMYLTYGAGKTKANISAEDLRILLSAQRRIRRERIEEDIENLVRENVLFRQRINENAQILGIQKDFETWGADSEKVDKMSAPKVLSLNTKLNSNKHSRVDKMSTLIEYAYRDTGITHTGPQWGIERRAANAMMREALSATRNPEAAAYLLKDFIDFLKSQKWFSQVRMRFVTMSSRFKQYYKQVPAKDREARTQEQVTGYRVRYNIDKSRWELTDERIKSDHPHDPERPNDGRRAL